MRAGAYELEEENVRLTVTRCHRGVGFFLHRPPAPCRRRWGDV